MVFGVIVLYNIFPYLVIHFGIRPWRQQQKMCQVRGIVQCGLQGRLNILFSVTGIPNDKRTFGNNIMPV